MEGQHIVTQVMILIANFDTTMSILYPQSRLGRVNYQPHSINMIMSLSQALDLMLMCLLGARPFSDAASVLHTLDLCYHP